MGHSIITKRIALLLFCALAMGHSYVWGELEKVYLKADYTSYKEATKFLVASSNVTLKFRDVEISAPKITIDTDRQILWGTGKIEIKRGEDHFNSSYIFMDMKENIIEIRDIHIGITPADSKEILILKATSLKDINNKIKIGKDGLLTSCDLDDPHYYVWSSHFDYKTKDRIIGYNTILYTPFFLIPFPVPFITLHYTPMYYYDISTKKTVWNFPAIGKKESNGWGWFVQNTIDYDNINGKDSSVFIDWFENKGIGAGIKHQYLINGNQGAIYYYQLTEQDILQINERKGFEQAWKISENLDLNIDYGEVDAERLSSSGRQRSMTKGLNLNYVDVGDKVDVDYKENHNFNQNAKNTASSFNKSFNGYTTWSGRYNEAQNSAISRLYKTVNLKHNTLLSGDASFTESYDYSKESFTNLDQSPDEQLKLYLAYQKKFNSKFSTTVKFDHMIDLDEDRYEDDKFSNRNNFFFRHPEIAMTYTEANFGPFQLTESFTFGRYEEIRFDSLTNKPRVYPNNLENDFAPNTYIFKQKLHKNWAGLPYKSSFGFSAGFDQYIFKTPELPLFEGDAMNNLNFSVNQSSEFFNFIQTKATYKSAYAPEESHSPFFEFNESTRSDNTISETLTFFLDQPSKYYWSNQTNYSWISERWGNYNTKLGINPNKEFNMSIAMGQKLNPFTDFEKLNRYDPLSTDITISPTDNIKLNYELDLDLNKITNDKLTEVVNSTIRFDFVLGEDIDYRWTVQTFFTYDTQDQDNKIDFSRYEMQTISIVKKEHKRTVTLSFNKIREEVRFKYTIDAYPNDPIGVKKNKEIWKVEGILDDSTEERF